MTDEERQKLCDALRNSHPSRIMCKQAADEIERLAKEVARSHPQPAQIRKTATATLTTPT
jgi:hypothetical protein